MTTNKIVRSTDARHPHYTVFSARVDGWRYEVIVFSYPNKPVSIEGSAGPIGGYFPGLSTRETFGDDIGAALRWQRTKAEAHAENAAKNGR
jgi:hypothetical protein